MSLIMSEEMERLVNVLGNRRTLSVLRSAINARIRNEVTQSRILYALRVFDGMDLTSARALFKEHEETLLQNLV